MRCHLVLQMCSLQYPRIVNILVYICFIICFTTMHFFFEMHFVVISLFEKRLVHKYPFRVILKTIINTGVAWTTLQKCDLKVFYKKKYFQNTLLFLFDWKTHQQKAKLRFFEYEWLWPCDPNEMSISKHQCRCGFDLLNMPSRHGCRRVFRVCISVTAFCTRTFARLNNFFTRVETCASTFKTWRTYILE